MTKERKQYDENVTEKADSGRRARRYVISGRRRLIRRFEMKSVQYHFHDEIPLKAPINRIWDLLISAESWPNWAKGFRDITILGNDKTLIPGRNIACEVRGKIPYSLRFQLEILELRDQKLLKYAATGDLEGTGTWILEEDSSEIIVIYDWDVQTTGFWMNLLGKIGWIKRIMVANHDQVMREARINLERVLSSE